LYRLRADLLFRRRVDHGLDDALSVGTLAVLGVVEGLLREIEGRGAAKKEEVRVEKGRIEGWKEKESNISLRFESRGRSRCKEESNLNGVLELVSVRHQRLKVDSASGDEGDGELVVASSVTERALDGGLLIGKGTHRDGNVWRSHTDLDVDTGLLDQEETVVEEKEAVRKRFLCYDPWDEERAGRRTPSGYKAQLPKPR
jgi:hypothetical protein